MVLGISALPAGDAKVEGPAIVIDPVMIPQDDKPEEAAADTDERIAEEDEENEESLVDYEDEDEDLDLTDEMDRDDDEDFDEEPTMDEEEDEELPAEKYENEANVKLEEPVAPLPEVKAEV